MAIARCGRVYTETVRCRSRAAESAWLGVFYTLGQQFVQLIRKRFVVAAAQRRRPRIFSLHCASVACVSA